MHLLIDSVLIASAAVLALSVSLQVWKLIKSHRKLPGLPPGPGGLPILGYLPYVRPNIHIQFTELAEKYGPIYKLWLGKKLCIVISSPSLIKEVLRDHDTIFANRDKTVTTLIGTYNANDVGWSRYGPQWRTLRRLFVREMLGANSLDGSINLRRDEVRKNIRNVCSESGRPVNICELAFKINLNVVLSMACGSTIELEKRDKVWTEFPALVERISDVMGKPNVSDFFPILARFDMQGVGKEMTGLMQILDRFLEDLIDRSTTILSDKVESGTNKGRKDFVQMLVEMKKKDDGGKMSLTRTQMKAMLVNVIAGGTHTSSSTVEWVMTELMSNPNVMEKVQEELNQVVGLNNIVEEVHIPKLLYLDAVLKETMRLHPTGPFLSPRTPSESCTVGGYTIPKDSAIFLNIWAIQRDPVAWVNPLEFKPERFLGDDGNLDFSGKNFNYIPFGSGRRICAGLPLAERMLSYVLASLLHSFEWKLPEGEKLDMEDKFGSVLRKKNPLFVIPFLRLTDSNLYL
ncbi:UNVERIFIED_CONTAM: Flavonoid 3'-monooxygenase [Sesamum radiatum]|uniref:Flavonoid 3'-monooxygenase n=1 Tax=Sesamum radiatum TaxID=300843 RepID=A0AAW2U1P8_SESRA